MSDHDDLRRIVGEAAEAIGGRIMGEAELTSFLDQMQAYHNSFPLAPDVLPPAPIDFIPSGRWDEEADELRLLTPAEFERVPDGATLVTISNRVHVKGQDPIDLDTRFGFIAYGFRMSQLAHVKEGLSE